MLKGKGVSLGIGFGKVILLKEKEYKVEQYKVENEVAELEIFYNALNTVISETRNLIKRITGTKKEIMEAYLMILKDPVLINESINMIENEKYNAAYAVEEGFNKVIQMFQKMDDSYMSERSLDIIDMKKKILSKLLRQEEINLSKLPKDTIIIAKELTTSDTAKLDFKNISGIVTEIGGSNSHVSIMARSNGIPAIVGVKDVTELLNKDDFVVINSMAGEIFINPSEEECIKLRNLSEKLKQEKSELERYKNKKTVTVDGHKVEILSNIGVPQDAEIALSNTAEGIGLFRSEFLYMNSKNFPTEEEQFQAYKEVALKFENKKIIIRTLDIGGDKDLKYMKLPKEENPFLGYRAIRICLDNIELFKVQIKAILRASSYGDLSIMLPMISSIEELRDAKRIIEEAKEELITSKIGFKKDIKIGIMIEIPAAALISDALAKECDFFSIGTNDLIQYTVAVERGNEKIANLYTKFHPGVIKLIKFTIDNAHKNNISCGMCGEAATDSKYVPLLIGLGLDEFSMNASEILKVRKLIRNLNHKKCENLAENVLKFSSAKEVEKYLNTFIK